MEGNLVAVKEFLNEWMDVLRTLSSRFSGLSMTGNERLPDQDGISAIPIAEASQCPELNPLEIWRFRRKLAGDQ